MTEYNFLYLAVVLRRVEGHQPPGFLDKFDLEAEFDNIAKMFSSSRIVLCDDEDVSQKSVTPQNFFNNRT